MTRPESRRPTPRTALAAQLRNDLLVVGLHLASGQQFESNGVADCALDDAERQARQVQAAVRFLRRPGAVS
jgi:hypothetical protein